MTRKKQHLYGNGCRQSNRMIRETLQFQFNKKSWTIKLYKESGGSQERLVRSHGRSPGNTGNATSTLCHTM